jgi:hypothetical protein
MSEAEPDQGLTRRELIRKGAILGGTVMWVTPVVQTVGMSRALAATPSDTCIPRTPVQVVDNADGSFGTGGRQAGREDPDNVLVQDNAFYSLGFGGYVVVELDGDVFPSQDPTVIVIETTNGTNYPLESADVFIAQAEGGPFFKVGEADNTGGGGTVVNTIPVTGGGLPTSFRFIKVEDTTNPGDHSDPFADGFDVNYIATGC